LRDNETWEVGFDIEGTGNLTISSPNANWTELSTGLGEGEMSLVDILCGDESLKGSLGIIDITGEEYSFEEAGNQLKKAREKTTPPGHTSKTSASRNDL
jgi:hypothetical protein